MKRAARHKTGSVVFDKRRRTWNFLWWEDGKRRSRLIGTQGEFRTKGAAWDAVEASFPSRCTDSLQTSTGVPTVETLIDSYRREKMPQRFSTSCGYESWLRNHIVPRWGHIPLSELQARPVELWLQSLPLAPKSRVHVRGLIRVLWEYAMWHGDVAVQRNPIELVTVTGATKRRRQPRSLTVEEFQTFLQQLDEPIRTIALICVCFGLRISECLALKWSDVDWLNGKLRVERGIVRQRVADVKTVYSGRLLSIDTDLLEVFKAWKQKTQFSSDGDWVFASPAKLGRLPVSYPHVWLKFQQAALRAKIGKLGTHSMRHSYRSWLDAVGTPIAVQQKLMRHSDIRTTLNVYGDVVTDEMAQAHMKVVRLALSRTNGSQSDRKTS
jgi:integrase